ncbi:hypothetical protein I4F81_000058 [Pyropia yezoensis]|uniref:Uncharacterized protein n=1 Tax=Pyropia yezoensis TaxID=2788 RepID=A0ACC3BI68_PYRYE|nr:hypothetical protein I4F81_000058 [Neopyropia yezoensis]
MATAADGRRRRSSHRRRRRYRRRNRRLSPPRRRRTPLPQPPRRCKPPPGPRRPHWRWRAWRQGHWQQRRPTGSQPQSPPLTGRSHCRGRGRVNAHGAAATPYYIFWCVRERRCRPAGRAEAPTSCRWRTPALTPRPRRTLRRRPLGSGGGGNRPPLRTRG